MFTKKLIFNYNAQELLLATSRLTFALDVWVALILIMELIVLLFLIKKTQYNIFQPIVLGLHDYTSTCSTNNHDIIPHHFWLPFSLEPTIEHKPSYNFHSLISYNITFGPSHPNRLNCKV